ncbi:MAG: transcriptional repressor [Oscillospiraceae bacterium]|nr:transcriptional repressor [Oscillospiraceae bacterium]
MKRRSKKRDAIMSCLQGTKLHPTAEWVYQQLKPDYPDLSLGTVYRNLSQFKEEGAIVSVGTVGGLERFDADTSPHGHLVCRSCGAVVDAGRADIPAAVIACAEKETGGVVEASRLIFTGLCQTCNPKKFSS